MAFDPEKFATLMRDEGYSDEDVVKALREHIAPQMKAPEARPDRGMLPRSDLHDPEAQTPMASPGNPTAVYRDPEMLRNLDTAAARNPPEAGEPLASTVARHPQLMTDAAQIGHARERAGDPVANDPIAQMILSGVVGGGAGKLVAPAGRFIQGAVEGGTSSGVGGGGVKDVASGAILGAGMRGLSQGKDFAPGSQADQDAQALRDVGARPSLRHGAASGGMFSRPDYQALPPGTPGTVQMASSLEDRLAKSLTARDEAAGAELGAAEAPARERLAGGIPTAGARQQIKEIRGQNMGAQGPTLPEADARLSGIDRQLTQPPPAQTQPFTFPGGPRAPAPPPVDQLSFDELRNLQKAINYRLKNAAQGDFGKAGDVQAAGVLSKTMHEADPEFGQALDRYGAQQEKLSGLNDTLYREGGTLPPDRAGKIKTGVSRLANVGRSTQDASPNAIQEENMVREAVPGIDPGSSPLLAEIRARNVAQRREFQMPSIGGATPTVGRAIAGNVENLMFRGHGHGMARDAVTDPLVLWLQQQLTPKNQGQER